MTWLGTSPDSDESLEDDLDRDLIDDDDLNVEEHDEDDPDSIDTDDQELVIIWYTPLLVDYTKKAWPFYQIPSYGRAF